MVLCSKKHSYGKKGWLIGLTLGLGSTLASGGGEWVLPISRSHYPSPVEIRAYLQAVAIHYPEWVRFDEGEYLPSGSQFSQNLSGADSLRQPFVEIGQPLAAKKPVIYLVGGHHGDEKISVTTSLAVISELLNRAAGDPTLARIFETFTIVVQPLVNVSGYIQASRLNERGVDLNRDYPGPTRVNFGQAANETRAVQKLLAKLRPRASLAFHSGSEGVFYPWCSKPESAPFQRQMSELGSLVAAAMSNSYSVQCFEDYHTEGEFIDYVHHAYQTLALTVEVSKVKSPGSEAAPALVRRALDGTIAFIKAIYRLESGRSPTQLLVGPPAPDTQGVSGTPVAH